MIWDAITYREQSQLLWIVSNLNSNGYISEVLKLKVVSFCQGIPGLIIQQDVARPYVTKNV